MQSTMKINDHVTAGPQPSEQELQQLSGQGFKTVVNFRTEGEDEQPISPDAEAQKVRAAGMEYLHIPVPMDSMGPELVDQFREKYPRLPKPVFAHCRSGKRAGAMVMMNIAVEQGMTGDQTLQKAEAMGFECDKPELMEFVRNYVDNHSKQS